jgi:hypothetical protein
VHLSSGEAQKATSSARRIRRADRMANSDREVSAVPGMGADNSRIVCDTVSSHWGLKSSVLTGLLTRNGLRSRDPLPQAQTIGPRGYRPFSRLADGAIQYGMVEDGGGRTCNGFSSIDGSLARQCVQSKGNRFPNPGCILRMPPSKMPGTDGFSTIFGTTSGG